MLKSRNIPTKSIAVFLIIIVGVFALNEYLYIHKHICKDGSIVIHAHPYNKSQDSEQNKPHDHSAGDLVYLASFESFLPEISLAFVAAEEYSVTYTYSDYTRLFKSPILYLSNQERAPPSFA
jgi:hypothetical protein